VTTEQIARVCHDANRAYQIAIGQEPSLPWDLAPDWQRTSAIAGVETMLAGETASAEEQHERWLAHKAADGWVYGPTKDAVAKTHPCMLPYADLPEAERVKDHLFRAVVISLVTPQA